MHRHSHDHHHHHPEIKGKNLIYAIFLNVIITVSQVIGAILSHSLSLMSDALHNLSDVLALIISYVANRLSQKEPTINQSFGYKRAEILAAFINASTLLGISVYLIIEALNRLVSSNDVVVKGEIVVWLAAVNIVANGLSVLMIKKEAKHSMNMKAAYLHLFSDMLSSIAVLVGGLLMSWFNYFWVDSLLSIFIALYLIVSSWKLVLGSVKVLMQFTPTDINSAKVVQLVCEIEGVKNIHHVHVWQLTDHDVYFEAHIDIDNDMLLSQVDKVLDKVKHLLKQKFHIHHSTLQAEYNVCEDKSVVFKRG